ncbi:Beta-barrel assembly-enhancing protease [bacterium HR33]|nr:Beta-barrel assembly-enhancing protease [bacterium HR33]
MTDTRRLLWNGWYYDGQTARRHSVEVEVGSTGLALTLEDGSMRRWMYHEFRQVQGSRPGEPVRLERGPDPPEILVVEDQSFLERLKENAPGAARSWVTPAERRKRQRWLLAAGLLGLGAVGAGYTWGIPILAARVAAKIPPEWEVRLGESLVESVTSQERICSDPELQQAVQGVVERMSREAGSRYSFQATVVDASMVNAFAAPGGFIVIYRGLLEITESPEELAGVLAHEMQHVIQQHGIRAILREVPLRLVVAAVVGDLGTAGQMLTTASSLGSLRYRRADEASADRAGVLMLQKAGIDPNGMLVFFRRLAQQERGLPEWVGYLSTHPPTRDRIRKLEALIAGVEKDWQPLLGGRDWDRLKRSCATLVTPEVS